MSFAESIEGHPPVPNHFDESQRNGWKIIHQIPPSQIPTEEDKRLARALENIANEPIAVAGPIVPTWSPSSALKEPKCLVILSRRYSPEEVAQEELKRQTKKEKLTFWQQQHTRYPLDVIRIAFRTGLWQTWGTYENIFSTNSDPVFRMEQFIRSKAAKD